MPAPPPQQRPAVWLLGGVCAACVLTAFANQERLQRQEAARPAPAPAHRAENPDAAGGKVTGRVTVPAGHRMPEVVVFLESADPAFTFDPPAEPVAVSQKGAKFDPAVVVVPVGTRVEFRNDEERPGVEHNVFANSEPKKFDLGLHGPGKRAELVLFDKPGAVRLRCSVHRYMEGVVYVTPTPHFATARGDGTFEIGGVPPGAYRLRTWQWGPRYRERSVPVTVDDGGRATEVVVELSRK